ncbi:MAG TPA: hypothetical protein VEZ72_09445, partial [Paenibacillus sp.]|nr:hypothetical protein [Paenibacillus sp.]
YDALAADASVPGTWQDLARLRAAYLRIDGDPTAVRPALERLAAVTTRAISAAANAALDKARRESGRIRGWLRVRR